MADEHMRTVRLGQDVEGAAYFVICEALTNVVKHAQAATAAVELTACDGVLALEVRDDGTGIGQAGSDRGQGLTNLRDRVEALGGQLCIDSPGGIGTRVRAEFPIGATP
ncbi:MAG TPA: ATP-binding protein [Micromonosporaceae bacterium]